LSSARYLKLIVVVAGGSANATAEVQKKLLGVGYSMGRSNLAAADEPGVQEIDS
jgi:hypothetical protein